MHNTLGEIRSHFQFRFSLKAETHCNYGFVCIATPLLNGEVEIQTRSRLARRVCDTSEIISEVPAWEKVPVRHSIWARVSLYSLLNFSLQTSKWMQEGKFISRQHRVRSSASACQGGVLVMRFVVFHWKNDESVVGSESKFE
jgi:hypothetical protein